MRLGARAEAYEQIRNLLGRYCELMDAGLFSELAALFSRAELCGPDGRPFARGAEDVARQWASTQLYDGVPRTRHLTTNTVIELDVVTATASARSAYVVFQQVPDVLPLQPIIAGRYVDAFARDVRDEWYFTRRQYFVDLTGDLSHHLSR